MKKGRQARHRIPRNSCSSIELVCVTLNHLVLMHIVGHGVNGYIFRGRKSAIFILPPF